MTVTSGSAARDDRPLLERLIERMPVAIQADLHESADRLLAVRTPKQAQRALEDEYEHVLRRVLPLVVDRPLLRSRAAASAFTASFAALAATAEEADELLTFVSAGTLTAPGTSVVVAVGLLAAVAESYATASVRVHQLRANFVVVDADALAADVRTAVFGAVWSGSQASPSSTPQSSGRTGRGATRPFLWKRTQKRVARRVIDGAAARISTRWAVGAVPFVGIGYAAFDSARSVKRVLQLPVPEPPGRARSARRS
jgi:hypothetical protein